MDLETLCRRIEAVWLPGNFLARGPQRVAWQFDPAESLPWETYRGNLLPSAHCRDTRTFLAWNIRPLEGEELAPEPLLAIKLDPQRGEIHVLRAILCRRLETMEPIPGHPEERETTGWVRELVGTLRLADHAEAALLEELAELLHQAVVGASRLPLTSLEAPLPAFLFGNLHYLGRRPLAEDVPTWPLRNWGDALKRTLDPHGGLPRQAKLVEGLFRAAADEEEARAAALAWHELWCSRGGDTAGIFGLLRILFAEVSLSPWTGFVPRLFAGLDALAPPGSPDHPFYLDFLASLVHLLDRHLNAFDLVTYHHRGANYPDALLLEILLERLQAAALAAPDLFLEDGPAPLRRRRALRQALAIRHHYQGLPVPIAPTSPGERMRVLPAHLPTVPEEHILRTHLRPNRLFPEPLAADRLDPTILTILQQGFADLEDGQRRRELGQAIFLERPLGECKAPGEPDRTPLLAYLACSASLARRRLQELARLAQEFGQPAPNQEAVPHSTGWPIERVAPSRRPTVALADAAAVAGDFFVQRTLSRGLQPLLAHLGPAAPEWARSAPSLLARIAGEDPSHPTWLDADLRPRCRLIPDVSEGYLRHQGTEFPRRGMHLHPIE